MHDSIKKDTNMRTSHKTISNERGYKKSSIEGIGEDNKEDNTFRPNLIA